jgi:PAS domain S-box-containing protein
VPDISTTPRQALTAHQLNLLESTRVIPWVFNLQSRCFTYIGPQIEGLLGYPAVAWYEPQFWSRHLHPDDRELAARFFTQAATEGRDHEFEYRMIAAGGHTVWLHDIVHVVHQNGRPVALQGYLLDISEEKRAQEVMNSLARATSVLDVDAFLQTCVRDMARAYDARYAFIGLLKESGDEVRTLAVWAADRLAPTFEYRLEGTPCKDVLDLKKELIPRDAARLYPMDSMLADMQVESYFGAPLISSTGAMLGLVAVLDTRPMELSRWTAPILGVFATRISVELERKFANDSLSELNSLLEERVRERTEQLEAFSYSVSHDLRAPLRSITGFARALAMDYGDRLDITGMDYLSRVSKAAGRMSRLIDDLMELSRVSRAPLQTRALDLTALAREIMDALHGVQRERNVTLHTDAAMNVIADPGLLRIVLTNLLENALKYTRKMESAEIEFRAEDFDGEQVFSVSDNGIGFDPAQAERLFRPFQRLDNANNYPGTGVGLATVDRIIRRHGGRVWADTSRSTGARFCFTLGSPNPSWNL